MAISFRGKLARGRKIISEVRPSKLAAAGLLLAVPASILVFLLFFKRNASYALLYIRLSPEDAASIGAELEAQKIPYKLSGNGAAIEIPADRPALARLDLAVKGLPPTGRPAYELFSEQKPGAAGQARKSGLTQPVAGEMNAEAGMNTAKRQNSGTGERRLRKA